MATLTNLTKHSASVTDIVSHATSITTITKHGRFGDLTMSELASDPISRWASTTFDTAITRLTNDTKH